MRLRLDDTGMRGQNLWLVALHKILTKLTATVLAGLLAMTIQTRAGDPPASFLTPDRLIVAQGSDGRINQANDRALSQSRIAGEPSNSLPFVNGALLSSQNGRKRDAQAC